MTRFLAIPLLNLGLVAAGSHPAVAQDTPPSMAVTFIDVGQGDAIVIQSPEGKTALLDAGEGGVADFLVALGVDTIDIAIASHGHADHIGGMAEVLERIPVRYYMDNGVPHTTATYRNLMRTVRSSDAVYLQPVERTIQLGSVRLRILPPPGGGEQNDNSVGLLVEFGEFRALLTGDSETEELNYLLARGAPDVTVLKAAHHGSNNGVTPRWLSATSPEVVVISCGAGNSYGHPHAAALRSYEATAEEVYRTDRDGSVTVVGFESGVYQAFTGRGAAASRPRHPAPTRPQRPFENIGASSGTIRISVTADAPGNDNNNPNGEFVVIRNEGRTALAIAGFQLCDEARHCFRFPNGSTIAPGGSVVVYTGRGTSNGTFFYMGSGRAVWNNDGDVATLRNTQGEVVARHAY